MELNEFELSEELESSGDEEITETEYNPEMGFTEIITITKVS